MAIAEVFELHGLQDCVIKDIIESRNSRVYHLISAKRQSIGLKLYLGSREKCESGLEHELSAYSEFQNNSKIQIPKLISYSSTQPSITYEWIEGEKVNLDSKSKEVIFNCLLELKNATNRSKCLLSAVDSIFVGSTILDQFSERLKVLKEVEFFPNDLYLSIVNAISDFEKSSIIQEDFQDITLSFSDYGVHNLLKSSKGSYKFIDFEFFGRDSVVKVFCDLLCHPVSTFNSFEILNILNELDLSPETHRQILEFAPGISIKWALISAKRMINWDLHEFVGLQEGFEDPKNFLKYYDYLRNGYVLGDVMTYSEYINMR